MSLILIADDNPHAQRMGLQILSQEGHKVVTVPNGDEALQYLAENRPDLVMADIRMPGPNGFEICKHVKSEAKFEDVKVVLLAGPLEPFDPAEAESAGSDAVLHKPLDAYTLIDTVKSLLGITGNESEDGTDSAARPLEESSDGDTGAEASAAEEAKETEPPAANGDDVGDGLDPLADLVEQALGTADRRQQREQRVREAVREVLEASLPTIAETVAERVLARLEEE